MCVNESSEQNTYAKQLKAYHRRSARHVLVLETDLNVQARYMIMHQAELERKAGNELVAIMKRNYEQLTRTKRYRKLRKLYSVYAKTDDADNTKYIALQIHDMQEQYNVTWDFCRTSMIPIGKKYGIDAIFALTKAEDIWRAVEKCLYSNGKTIHFSKKEDIPGIRAKQAARGISIRVKNEKMQFNFNKTCFGVMIKDRFDEDEINAVMKYMSGPEVIDRLAVKTLYEDGMCIDTYRPCYAALVCKRIRGIPRVYLHLTIEGTAKPKYDSSGNLKHYLGKGKIGCDIGTQTVAYTSDTEVGLENLAERGSSITKNERLERLIYRAMDRSRRATNADNYHSDGTVKAVNNPTP